MDQATKILDLCKRVGIKTAVELHEYRQEHNCKSNADTIRALTKTFLWKFLWKEAYRKGRVDAIKILITSIEASGLTYVTPSELRFICHIEEKVQND